MLKNHVSVGITAAVDEDRVSPPPAPTEILAIEVEGFEKAIKAMERAGQKGEATALLWMEVATRKDAYRIATGKGFENPADVSRAEKACLVKVFHALNGFEWNRKFGWMGTQKSVSKPEMELFEASAMLFEGVETVKLMTSAMTSGLKLSGVGCRGVLPPALGGFETLRTINMNWNLIHGALPRDIGSLVSLETLALAGNKLTGTLDEDVFSAMSSLKCIDLSNNQLSGAIPDCFRGMKKLVQLNLANNNFTGSIPPSLSSCAKLEIFKVQQNSLSGEISAATFSTLVKLKEANLSQNKFSGPGLAPFCGCLSLERLQTSDNELSGHFPAAIERLTKLEILYIDKNCMVGTIPAEICSLTTLRRLNLSKNDFRGALPGNLGNLVNLQTLLATDNALIGPLPQTLSQMQKLRDFCIIKNYPSEFFAIPRGFTRNAFERIHTAGPAMGLNSAIWLDDDLYGQDVDKSIPIPFELFERRLYTQMGRP